MHYGPEDEEYLFDEELYCGLCAQQIPETQHAWTDAFRRMDANMIGVVEEELNRIAVSKSGMQAPLLEAMGQGISALAALRESGHLDVLDLPEAEYVRWVQFACTYFAPNLR
jgi:hypothetical protein